MFENAINHLVYQNLRMRMDLILNDLKNKMPADEFELIQQRIEMHLEERRKALCKPLDSSDSEVLADYFNYALGFDYSSDDGN